MTHCIVSKCRNVEERDQMTLCEGCGEMACDGCVRDLRGAPDLPGLPFCRQCAICVCGAPATLLFDGEPYCYACSIAGEIEGDGPEFAFGRSMERYILILNGHFFAELPTGEQWLATIEQTREIAQTLGQSFQVLEQFQFGAQFVSGFGQARRAA